MNKPCEQRFKGVENFLRRIAFNLGNSPSQTEVKVISCIPIDVSDLTYKIEQLERQLQEATKPKASPAVEQSGPKSNTDNNKINKVTYKNAVINEKTKKTNKDDTVVNTALYEGSYSKRSKTFSYSSDKSSRNIKHSDCCMFKNRKSNMSLLLPVTTTASKHEQPICKLNFYENDLDKVTTSHTIADYINLLKKRKKKRVSKRKSKLKTQLVYFANQTYNNPFNSTVNYVKTPNNAVSVSHTYLDNVFRKQYDPKFVVQEFSDTSHFSRPICRDTSAIYHYDSDVCSCCHGRYQNIDNYIPKGFDSINKLTQNERNHIHKTYYDSNLYDILPVKENTNKHLKEVTFPDRDIDIVCWSKTNRNNCRYNPKIVGYQTENVLKQRDHESIQKVKNPRKAHQTRINKQIHETSRVNSSKCYTDSGEISKIDTFSLTQFKKSEPIKTLILKNELIGTDDIDRKVYLNHQSTQLEFIPDDNENKTESTLNQIKSILQSVLEEVKTNPKIHGVSEKTPKIDAVVQKGSSQDNIQDPSTLLHSFIYNNSYNANSYLPSCSQAVSAGQYCLSGFPKQSPLKYLQNFPILVHPSGRHVCTCFYRNSFHKSSKCKQGSATAANTNKDTQIAVNKETEKLIKEIYKSMALGRDFSTRDNSISENDDLTYANNNYINESSTKDIRRAGIEILNKRDIEREALVSSNPSNHSKLVCTTTSTQSEDVRYTEVYFKPRNETNDRTLQRFEQHSNDAIADDDDTDESSDETNGEDIGDIKSNNERKGLLHRMFKSFKMFKKTKVSRDVLVHNESKDSSPAASDSDDYETIYSGFTAVLPPKGQRQNRKCTSRSNRNSPDYSTTTRSRSGKNRPPYLEQEFRRQWNEKLAFDTQRERKYSSERPFSKRSPQKTRTIYLNN